MCLNVSNAQGQFIKLELIRIETKTILPENYSQILLPANTQKKRNMNHYDPDNPDTYIELLQDYQHKRAHVLVQADFYGNLLYVAVSNNILTLIVQKEKPLFVFNQCLEDVNNGFFSLQENIEKIIKCILDRLSTASYK